MPYFIIQRTLGASLKCLSRSLSIASKPTSVRLLTNPPLMTLPKVFEKASVLTFQRCNYGTPPLPADKKPPPSAASTSSATPGGKLKLILPTTTSGFDLPLTTRKATERSNKDDARRKNLSVMTGYAMANEMDIERLANSLADENHVYRRVTLPDDIQTSVLMATARYAFQNQKRDLFVFRNGVVVLWNMNVDEQNLALEMLLPFRVQPYPFRNVIKEKEELFFTYSEKQSHLKGEDIYLFRNPKENLLEDNTTCQLDQFAFSDALSLSVKLSMLEANFNKTAAEMEPWIENLRNGNVAFVSHKSVMIKTGELFTLRHLINVSSDILETPDAYWERVELEHIYNMLKKELTIDSRARILNTKLNLCCELTELLSSQLNNRHSSRLEIMIILLIMIEVFFECVHYYKSTRIVSQDAPQHPHPVTQNLS